MVMAAVTINHYIFGRIDDIITMLGAYYNNVTEAALVKINYYLLFNSLALANNFFMKFYLVRSFSVLYSPHPNKHGIFSFCFSLYSFNFILTPAEL
jgi:hypothetical protein